MSKSGRFLLDTNVIVDVWRGHEETIAQVQILEKVYTTVITLGELRFGALKSNQPSKKQKQVDALEASMMILDIDKETTHWYGKIKEQLKRQGTPIPENDVWIAAVASANEMTLLTSDRHFQKVENQIDIAFL